VSEVPIRVAKARLHQMLLLPTTWGVPSVSRRESAFASRGLPWPGD